MTTLTIKDAFTLHNIKQHRLVEILRESQIFVSKATISGLVTHNRWPPLIDSNAIKLALKQLFKGLVKKEDLKEMLNQAPRVGVNCQPPVYGVISLLSKYKLSQADMQRALKNTDITLSASAITQILRHGNWPKTIDAEVIKAAINDYLSSYATQKEIDHVWNENRQANRKPKEVAASRSKAVTKTIILDQPEQQMLNPNTMRHFKLTRHPFENEIRSEDDLFMSDQQILLREAMVQAALGGSIFAVTGECGAGKTEVRKGFLEYIHRNHPEIQVIEPMVINKKRLTPEMIFDAIAEDLNITNMPAGLERRARKVDAALRRSVKTGNRHVLVIEEAHDLTNNVIKQLKRIWELSDGFTRLISIILIGQPELESILAPSNYEVREFARRCNMMKVYPLGHSITEYIAHKFQRCNVNYLNVIEPSAIAALQERMKAKISYGMTAKAHEHQDMSYPLIVNNWLVIAMNLANELGEPKVTSEMVKEIK